MSIILQALERARNAPKHDNHWTSAVEPSARATMPTRSFWPWIAMGFAFVAAAALAALWVAHQNPRPVDRTHAANRQETPIALAPQRVASDASIEVPAGARTEPSAAPFVREPRAAALVSSAAPGRAASASTNTTAAGVRPPAARTDTARVPVTASTGAVASPSANTSTPASAPAASTPTATSSSEAEAIVGFAQLPAASRAVLPPISLGGIMYSESAAQRAAIINGEVVQEGAKLGTGTELLRIEPNAIVVRTQGQRVRISAP